MGSSILEAARKSRSVSQVQLARRAHTFQANISSIESGKTDPGISTIEQCLSPLGFTLIAIPTNKPSVAEFALRVGKAIQEKKESKAFRLVIQLSDNLRVVEPEICLALCVSPAPSTGSAQHDALLAAVVEYSLDQRKLPIPKWVAEDFRVLRERWVVDGFERDLKALAKVTPKAFRRHNILINKREFESI